MTDLQTYKIALKYLKSQGTIRNQQHLADILDVNKGTVSQIINGNIDAPKHFVDLFLDKFKIFDRNWLLTGEGEMLNQEKEKKQYPESSAIQKTTGEDLLMESQTRLIKMQEQLMLNNTKLVETNSRLTEQLIELYNKHSEMEGKQIREEVKKAIEIIKSEAKNADARGDAKCADAG